MTTVGFITGVFDIPHESHFLLLKACKNFCTTLIVGITTDILAQKQKREPIMSFNQRRSILENCKHVDVTVSNNGDTKAISWDKLRFDVLFSGEEYRESQEFYDFRRDCPDIKIIFIPRDPDVSSTRVIKNLMLRFSESQTIISSSVEGHITRYGFGPYFITKPVHFATSDTFGFYKFFQELPRNFKSEHHHASASEKPSFPMISGINSNREIMINIALQHKPWCTFISTTTVYEDKTRTHTPLEQEEKFETLLDFANHVAFSRQVPTKIVHLVQRDAGITFETWCKTLCHTYDEFRSKVDYIENVIIADLEAEGIVHGDIHPRNSLIDKFGNVSIIDMGWVTSRSFELCKREATALEIMLHDHFDVVHFRKSMRVCSATKYWLDNVAL